MFHKLSWNDFCRMMLEKEGFRQIEMNPAPNGGNTLLAADPKRFLLLSADSERRDFATEVFSSMTVSGFMNFEGLQDVDGLLERFSATSQHWPLMHVTLRPRSKAQLDALRDPKRVSLLAKWKPIDDVFLGGSGIGTPSEWQSFRKRAPRWVKDFIG